MITSSTTPTASSSDMIHNGNDVDESLSSTCVPNNRYWESGTRDIVKLTRSSAYECGQRLGARFGRAEGSIQVQVAVRYHCTRPIYFEVYFSLDHIEIVELFCRRNSYLDYRSISIKKTNVHHAVLQSR